MALPPAPAASSAAVRKVMQGNRRRDTRPERRLRSELHRLGLRFRVDLPVVNAGKPVRPDVVFTRWKLAVFVDGCFWHGCPKHGTTPRTNAPYWLAKIARNVDRDRRIDRHLDDAGWAVLRLWEHTPPAEAAAVVAQRVAERQASEHETSPPVSR